MTVEQMAEAMAKVAEGRMSPIGRARSQYIRGAITLEEFERRLGFLMALPLPSPSPADPPSPTVAVSMMGVPLKP